MGQGCFRMLVGVAGILAALVIAAPASASTGCAARLVADWRDGRIDGTYAIPCYRQALARLPEDVLVYSSAKDDITRALQARLADSARSAAKPSSGSGDSSGVSPGLIVAITVLLLVSAGSVAAALR
jgi:hypothetical protein